MTTTPTTDEATPTPAAKDEGASQSKLPALSGKTIGVGAAVGIGSAAIVAALLFVNRGKK